MKNISHYLNKGGPSVRATAPLALLAVAGVLVLLTGMPGGFAVLVVSVLVIAIDAGIWLRNNPTLKQMERRRQKAEASQNQPSRR